MPRNFKARKSYHGDAATLLKLAQVIASDADVQPDKGQAVCQKLTELAGELASLRPYTVTAAIPSPATPSNPAKPGDSKRATAATR